MLGDALAESVERMLGRDRRATCPFRMGACQCVHRAVSRAAGGVVMRLRDGGRRRVFFTPQVDSESESARPDDKPTLGSSRCGAHGHAKCRKEMWVEVVSGRATRRIDRKCVVRAGAAENIGDCAPRGGPYQQQARDVRR